MEAASDRSGMFDTYKKMDEDDLCSSVLDLYAENATQPDMMSNRTIWPVSGDSRVVNLVEGLFDSIGIEDAAFAIVRTMAKFGVCCESIIRDESGTIVELENQDPQEVEPIFDPNTRNLKGYRVHGQEVAPWDLLYFRLLGQSRNTFLGDSILHSAVSSWKRVRMCEDQAVLYRLRSIPGRDVWKVEVGPETSINEALRVVKKVRQAIRSQLMYSASESKLRTDYNPLSVEDSYFLPTRGGTPIYEVDRTSGESATQDVADLLYFLKRFFGNVRVPMAYFGFDESGGLFEHDRSLVQKDIRFARGCKKLQRAFVRGVYRLCQIQCMYRRVDVTEPSFDLRLAMVPMSYLEEQQRQELLDIRLNVMDRLARLGSDLDLDHEAWFQYIMRDIGGFTPSMVKRFLGDTAIEGGESLSERHQRALNTLLGDPQFKSRIQDLIGAYMPRMNTRNDGALPESKEANVESGSDNK